MTDYQDLTILAKSLQAESIRLGAPVGHPVTTSKFQAIIGSPEGRVPGVASDVVVSRDPVGIWQKTGSATEHTNTGWVLVAGNGVVTQQDLPFTNLVTDYGADPTGTNPASAQLDLAISDASASGTNVNAIYIPPGTYRMDSTVRHQANVHVFGAGANTILQFDPGVSAWDFDPGFLRAELSDLVILGIFGAPAPIGIDLNQSQRCWIHDLQIWDFQTGILLSDGASFSAYNTIGWNVEVNRSTVVGIRALANANGNQIVGTRIFFTYNGTSTGIGLDIEDAQGLLLNDIQIEAADTCLRTRSTSGLLSVGGDVLYLEPGTNPNTAVVGNCFDIDFTNVSDGIETFSLTNVIASGNRGTCNLPPEALVEFDAYSRAFFGARFGGQAVPKRNYTYNGTLLYYGLPSVLPGWGVSGVPPTLSADALHVTGSRSLRATANAPNSNVACGFTVSDEGVEWITAGIRFQIIAGNVGFTFTGTVGANSRQYMPEPLPADTWRTAWVNVPVDPNNRSGALGCVVDSVNGTGSILIDEIWAVPGKYAIPSTQYGERIQFLPAPIPILTRTGVTANETFGPIDLLTLPATLAPPLNDFSTAPAGTIGAVLRMFINCTGAPAGLIAAFHQIYVDVVASGAIVPASFEFLQAVYSGQFHTKDIIKRGTTVSGGYNAADGYATDYSIALIAWVIG